MWKCAMPQYKWPPNGVTVLLRFARLWRVLSHEPVVFWLLDLPHLFVELLQYILFIVYKYNKIDLNLLPNKLSTCGLWRFHPKTISRLSFLLSPAAFPLPFNNSYYSYHYYNQQIIWYNPWDFPSDIEDAAQHPALLIQKETLYLITYSS